jgi:hypothetical protein
MVIIHRQCRIIISVTFSFFIIMNHGPYNVRCTLILKLKTMVGHYGTESGFSPVDKKLEEIMFNLIPLFLLMENQWPWLKYKSVIGSHFSSLSRPFCTSNGQQPFSCRNFVTPCLQHICSWRWRESTQQQKELCVHSFLFLLPKSK